MSPRKCNAKSKRTGKRCRANAVRGRNVCYHHGGATPRGPASPHWRHGRYSRLLPSSMAADYEESVSSFDNISLREEIGVLDAHLAQLVADLHDGSEPDHTSPRRAWQAVLAAIERRRRLCDTERRLMEAARNYLDREQALFIVNRILAILRQHVSPETLSEVASEFELLVADSGLAGPTTR